MYKIVRKNKKLPKVLKNTFSSYEEARQAIRKWIRMWLEREDYDLANRTATIGAYGFSVVRSSELKLKQ